MSSARSFSKEVSAWKELATQNTPPPHRKRRRILGIINILLLIILIFGAVHLLAAASDSNDQLLVRIGDQQAAVLDLRQGQPISPYLFGVNTFPEVGTTSGFMDYSPPITNGLQNAHIKLMRFPGGNWGETHLLSFDQLNAFSALLSETNAEGMVQVRLSSSLDSAGMPTDLSTRVNTAGRWVDYMNNPKSDLRTGKNAPFHPIKFWSVGNEPDKLINSTTGKTYTVEDYVNAFIQYSRIMHQSDPTIQVFGPEISQFFGLGAGPTDANGALWMESFLKGVGAYEQANHVTLLDGVSFHSYQFTDARSNPSLLLSSTDAWNYLLPSLRQIIRRDLGRDVPIAITEINTNRTGDLPSRGLAALWWADTLGTLMNQQVAYVAYFSAEGVDAPYPLFTTDGLHQTPMFRVMQLFSHLQRNLIPLAIQREPISVYATQDDMHQTLGLLFINKVDTTQLAQVSAGSSLFNMSPWHSLDISLSGYSMVLVTLHRGGDAEAYSYIAPTSNDTNVAPLTYTLCGHQTDALAAPC